ncbi:VanW family protein [Thermovorax subterraneus]|nr:VanW family protein [Thermovorax subterraneus]
MNKRSLYILLLALFLGITISLSIYFFEAKNSENIVEGIYIGQVYIGGLVEAKAKEKLSNFVNMHLRNPLILQYSDKTWNIIPQELVEVQIEKAVQEAISTGKSKNFLFKFFNRLKFSFNPKKIELAIKIKDEPFQKILEIISGEIACEPKNAEFKIIDGIIRIEKEKKGIKVDEENLKQEILKIVWSEKRKISVPVIAIKPEITQETLSKMNIKEEIVSFSTKFDKTQAGRSTNIRLAAEKLKNYIIPPGEIFSFNDVIGKRTIEEGYKEAPIFLNNKVSAGIGGGVCQLSTTLYNLALLADLEIIERSNHSLPVSYVPLGRDATVNYGVIDLKFKNSTGGYLLLYTEIKGDTLTMKFYGSKKSDKKINLVSEVVKRIPPPVNIKEDYSLEKGKIHVKEGKPGYQVRVWKITTYNDGRQEKKLVSTDIYNPTTTIVYVGKKEPQTQTHFVESQKS